MDHRDRRVRCPRDTWSSTEWLPAVPAATRSVFKVPALVAWTTTDAYVSALPDMDSEPQPDSTTTLWVRDFPARPLDVPALTALCDVFYPRVFRRRGTFVPAGTVSLTTYFHAGVEVVEEQSDQPILATARAADFGGGYFDQSARLWSGNGRLLATSHQLVYFKY